MTTSNYKINKENFIQNGEEFWVEGVEYDIIEKIPCWKLFCFRMEEGKKISVELPVVMREHYKDYKKRKNELVTGMQNANYKKKGFHKNLIKKFTEKFCMVQHAHALTAYKAQGSTIDTVFFDCTDVLDVKPLNDLKKLQSIYVGLTRAANRLVIY